MRTDLPERRNEIGLLLAACTPGAFCPQDLSSVRWDYVNRFAEAHGILPLLWNLVQLHPDTSSSLKLEAAQYAKRQLRLSLALTRLLGSFDAAGVNALPYKGPVLAQTLYGNLALRQSIDLDILVARDQVAKTRDLLRELGFRESHASHSDLQQQSLLGSHCEIQFENEDGVCVELHWAVLPREFGIVLPSSKALNEGARIDFCGQPVHTFRAEELVLVLAAHATKHCWNRLIFLADLSRAMLVPGLNLQFLAEQAAASHTARMLGFGLALSKEVLGQEIADFTISPAPKRSYIKAAATRLFSDDVVEIASPARHRFALSVMNNRMQAAHYCWNVLRNPQPADFSAATLPRSLFFLYPAVRSARLAAKTVRSATASR